MDIVLILAGVVIVLTSSGSLIHTRRVRLELHQMAQGMAQAMQMIHEKVEMLENIPETLREIGVGGVQLMPQKSFGELILEKFMSRWDKPTIKDHAGHQGSWPQGEDAQNQPLVGDSAD